MPAAPEEAAQGWVQALDLSPKPFSALWLSVVPKWSQPAYLQKALAGACDRQQLALERAFFVCHGQARFAGWLTVPVTVQLMRP